MPANPWPQEDERLVALGPAEASGTKMDADHNYTLWAACWITQSLQEMGEHRGLARVPGKSGDDAQRREKFPDVEMLTEGGDDYKFPDY